MFELSPGAWIIAVVAAMTVGMTKAGIVGIGILAIPLMAGLFPAKASTGILLPMLITGDIIAVWYYRRHADWAILTRLLPAAIIGVIIGFFLMGQVNDTQLKKGIGGIILFLVVMTYLRNAKVLSDEKIPTGPIVSFPTGVAAGITTMMANAAGPIMMVYLVAMKLPKNSFIGTTAWFFLVINIFKLPFSTKLGLISRETLMFDLQMVPCIVIGAVVGIVIVKRMSNRSYTFWVQALAGLAALKLLFG